MLLYFIGLGSSEAVVLLPSKLLVKRKVKARRAAVPPHHTPQLLLQIPHTVMHSLTRRKKEKVSLKPPYQRRLASICSRLMVASIAMHLKGLKTNI
jgi:hypothetical protein